MTIHPHGDGPPPALVAFFESRISPEPNSGCWLWTGSTKSSKPGPAFTRGFLNRHEYCGLAHRLSYQMYVGPIPDGLCVCHKCDTPLCVNPDHLFLGTVADNNKDCRLKGRARSSHPGSANGYARLTEQAVLKILRDTRSVTEIAKAWGVAHQTVSDIRNRKTWVHL